MFKLRTGKRRPYFLLSMASGCAFIAAAMWSWGLSFGRVSSIFFVLLAGLVAIVLVAFTAAALITLVKKKFRER